MAIAPPQIKDTNNPNEGSIPKIVKSTLYQVEKRFFLNQSTIPILTVGACLDDSFLVKIVEDF